jgi:hypothetical protein
LPDQGFCDSFDEAPPFVGAGLYFGTVGLDIERTGITNGIGYFPLNGTWRRRKTSFGSQEGLSMRVNITPRFGLVGEAIFRQASLDGAKGTSVADGVITENASMWIAFYGRGQHQEFVTISASTLFSPEIPLKKADVSLSGFSFRLGFELRFGAL